MKRQLIKYILRRTPDGTPVTVAGWVRTRRDSKGGFSFVEINDGSCFANLQIIADAGLPNYADDIQRLHPGSAVVVTGLLTASQGAGQAVELHAADVRVLGFCEPSQYPLQKKRISFERLREVAHLRPRTNTFGAVARVRNVLADATHRFFQERDFLYVHTPIITAGDCEGAGEMFRVTAPDEPLPSASGDAAAPRREFFGRPTFLTVSGQLEGETYACALSNIYTFGPTFRAENSNTSRHLAEFWMVEPEMAFADISDDAELAEAYVRALFRAVLSRCPDDLAFFNKHIAPDLLERLSALADRSFERITYTQAVDILEQADVHFDFPVKWGEDLQSEHERFLTERHFKRPVIVTDYPRDIKAFYMRLNDDERTVAAMDVLLPGVGEIIGGSQREDRLTVLEQRMRALGLSPENYAWYLDLRRFGSVPHAGFGLGFERMVQFCTGMRNIRDVIPFPRTPRHAEF